jgi:hypothetical protein
MYDLKGELYITYSKYKYLYDYIRYDLKKRFIFFIII